MTLYDLIMREKGFTKSDWSDLGKSLIQDDDTIRRMLMEGYEAVASDE